MHYRQKSTLFAAPWLVIGLVAVVVSGGMTVSDFEKPELLVAALFVGLIVGMAVEQCLSVMRRQAWRARNQTRWQGKTWRGEHRQWSVAAGTRSGAAEKA